MKKTSSLKNNQTDPTFELEGRIQGGIPKRGDPTSEKSNSNNDLRKKEVWISVQEGGILLGITARVVRKNIKKGKYTTKKVHGNGGIQYRILLSSLPEPAQKKYWKEKLSIDKPEPQEHMAIGETELEIYSRQPAWAREFHDRWNSILTETEGMSRTELDIYISAYKEKYPGDKISYGSVMRRRKDVREKGKLSLIPGYGKRAGRTEVKEEWLKVYAGLFLTEDKRSVNTCWEQAFMEARKVDGDLIKNNFPSPSTFDKALKSKVSKSSIYLYRYGYSAWNKKFGYYVDRDHSDVYPGMCYVSDHAQIDVGVEIQNGKTKKICFPWVTAFRDLKSGKWVGWLIHPEAPNSDHILMSFYTAAKDFGIPLDVMIDNGKDYRCYAFSGGRVKTTFVKPEITEDNKRMARAVLSYLGINVHFCIVENAQAKPIERDFLKIKEWLSKNLPGYRGGNIKERPEKLQQEIKDGAILKWDEFAPLFDRFIVERFNRKKVDGKILKGMCPDELWEKECQVKRVTSLESLKLFCMRSSGVVSIGRIGIKDSETGFHYWGEWMSPLKGRKVYMRRDVKKYQEAYVFDAEPAPGALDFGYLGKATIKERVSAIISPDNDIERNKLKEEIARRRRDLKIAKDVEIRGKELSYQDRLSNMEEIVKLENEERGYIPSGEGPKITEVVRTPMDKVIKQLREEKAEKPKSKFIYKPGPIVDEEKIPIFAFRCDRERYLKKRAEEKARREAENQ